MTDSLKSILAGAISGIITSYLAVPAIGATAAIAMPSGWPVALWSALVVFGIGAFLPAWSSNLRRCSLHEQQMRLSRSPASA